MAERHSWIPKEAQDQCVVLIGGAQALKDEAARVGAAAGVALIEAPSVAAARAHHPSVVLLASDNDDELLPPGCEVILVGLRGDEDAVWAAAAGRGAGRVAILPQAAGWLAEHLGRARSAAAAGPVLGVLGAAGGAGASTLSCWLADCAASTGAVTLLVDGDSSGGGLDLALGGPAPGLRWRDLGGVRGALNPAQFAAALPQAGGFSVLSHGAAAARPPAPGRVSSAAGPVMDAARRHFGLVVIDLGTAPDPPLLASCDRVLLLVPARLRPVAAAAELIPRLAPAAVQVVLRGPLVHGLHPHRVGKILGTPDPAVLPRLHGVAAAEAQGRLLARGRQRSPRRLCRFLLDQFLEGRAAA